MGRADRVDRWRTYLESGVPEYWVINAGITQGPLPPRTGLFLRNAGGAWASLEGEGLVEAGSFRGLPVLSAGLVRSAAVPGLSLDLASFWDEVRPRA